MNVYWVNPSIFYQGSISGEYKSSLRDWLDILHDIVKIK
jgi:hypothetical protein